MQVGRALLITVLDMEDANPCSRVPRSPFRTVQAVRHWLLATIKVGLNRCCNLAHTVEGFEASACNYMSV